jgi:hypothetical protein
MIAMLNLHCSRFGDLEGPGHWRRHCIAHRGQKRIGETLSVQSILQ